MTKFIFIFRYAFFAIYLSSFLKETFQTFLMHHLHAGVEPRVLLCECVLGGGGRGVDITKIPSIQYIYIYHVYKRYNLNSRKFLSIVSKVVTGR